MEIADQWILTLKILKKADIVDGKDLSSIPPLLTNEENGVTVIDLDEF